MSAPPSRAVWQPLLARTSTRTRVLLGSGAALGVIGRLTVVATAMQLAHANAHGAAVLGAIAGIAFVIQRVVLASARVLTECDLYRASARALLDADVLEVPGQDLQRVVFEANQVGRNALAGTLPTLVADVVASIVIAPLLGALFPVRVLAVAMIGLVAVLASLLALRRATMRMQNRVLQAAEKIADGMLVVCEGRLELVARGGETAFATSYEATLEKYAQVATKASLGSALLGRVPLLVGAAIVAAVVAVDSASRDAVAMTVLGEALVLAAAAPALLGVVFGMHELVRSTRVVAPLVAILRAPRRAEHSTIGAAPPPLPAAFAFENVTFTYDDERKPALTNVEGDWKVGEALMVVGPNGGGKSTLLRLVLGLRAPTSGVVRLDSMDLAEIDIRRLRKRMAYLPQRPYLGEAYGTVRAAMRLGFEEASDAAITASLDRVGLLAPLRTHADDPLAVKIGVLSAGQRQRVAVARILLQDASIVVLDEPDANLDREGVRLVAGLVAELVARGKMVIVAAHASELLELSASRLAVGPPGSER